MHLPTANYEELNKLINAGQGGQMAIDERNRRLLSGDATHAALVAAVNDLVRRAPQDHDVIILADDLAIHHVTFIQPHTFLFEGVDQDGHHAGVVLHFSQVRVRVIYRPKRLPDAPRVITGFKPNPA